jgi:hypothetical protein
MKIRLTKPDYHPKFRRIIFKILSLSRKMDLASQMNNLSMEDTKTPSLEELQKIYQKTQDRKMKQCEYQRKYAEKKKNETISLSVQVQQLQEQNQKLIQYYQLFELLKLNNPQLAGQLFNQLKTHNTIVQTPFQTQISSPAPLGHAVPLVSLRK